MSASSGQFAVRITTDSRGNRQLEFVQAYGPPLTKNSLKVLRQRASKTLNIATKRFELLERGMSFRGSSVILRVKLFANMAAHEIQHKAETLIKSLRLRFVRLTTKHRKRGHRHQPTVRRPYTGSWSPAQQHA
jgi:hypothetical protein